MTNSTTKEALEPIWCANCGNQIYQRGDKWYHLSTAGMSCNVVAYAIPRLSAPIAPVVDDNDRVLLEALRRVRADQDDFWTFYQADPLMVKAADRIEELLRWHSTEQSMHAAWRKRAEEAEATLAAPASTVAPQQSDDESRAALNEWIRQDVEATSKQSLLKLAWSLGVAGNHEHELRKCLLSVPELHLEDYPGGVAEIGPLDIQEDCLRAIDYLKTLIVLLNRLAIGDLDPAESKRVVAESTEYLKRMRNFPIRSQYERAKSDRD